MRSILKSAALFLTFGAAALAGVRVGAMTASPSPKPLPTTPVAAIPTSTPDLRTPLPTATLTTTVALSPTAAALASAAALVSAATPVPEVIVPLRPTPAPIPTRSPPGSAVVYMARPGAAPLAVAVDGNALGVSASDRIYWRLRALPMVRAPEGSVNFAARSGTSLVAVTVVGDGNVILEYALVGGTWGFGSQDDLRLLMQQIVFTATEEARVDLVSLQRSGGGNVPVRPAEQWTFATKMSREDLLTLR